jgi:hypothetical protein
MIFLFLANALLPIGSVHRCRFVKQFPSRWIHYPFCFRFPFACRLAGAAVRSAGKQAARVTAAGRFGRHAAKCGWELKLRYAWTDITGIPA